MPPSLRRRKSSLRLEGYDYTRTGAYFITICSHQRNCIFGQVASDEVELSDRGRVVLRTWLEIPEHAPDVTIDAFVVMPNHVHGILMLGFGNRSPASDHPSDRAAAKALGVIVGGCKASVSRQVNMARQSPGDPIWQRGYYDRVIRNEEELLRVRQYIFANPRKWHNDQENPNRR